MMTRFLLLLVRVTACLPLPWVRTLGRCLGWLLYALVGTRRRVVLTNLRLCFPRWSVEQRQRLARQTFVHFAQAWLDRGWLWFASPEVLLRRLQLVGDVGALQDASPTVVFAPHFMGLDAGWTALTQQIPRHWMTIYTDQANAVADAWILRGRRRFGSGHLYGRIDGVKPIIAGLKQGAALYLLPDMNFGPEESVYVPFYGIQAATVPSLSRFAKLGRAKVVPVLSRMTAQGYSVEVLPAWDNFPTGDTLADTETMNRKLEQWIDSMPDQYYWVHKRFKDRPAGEVPPY